MTEKLYFKSREPRVQARILDIQAGDSPIIRLDRTIFHPQGGGQKADRGTIGGVAVLSVRHNEGEVDHVVSSTDGLAVGDSVELVLDEEWRESNSRYHSAGHLIAAIAEECFPGLRADSGHHWPGEARVEFSGNIPEDLEAARALIVSKLSESIERELTFDVDNPENDTRTVRIGSFAAVPCGGTHVKSSGALAGLQVSAMKKKSQKLRVSYDLLS